MHLKLVKLARYNGSHILHSMKINALEVKDFDPTFMHVCRLDKATPIILAFPKDGKHANTGDQQGLLLRTEVPEVLHLAQAVLYAVQWPVVHVT